MPGPLWTPDGEKMERSAMVRFMKHVGLQAGTDAAACAALYRYSVEETEAFWSAVWDFCGVVGEKGEGPYLIDGDKMPGAQFFPHARLNYAENLLKYEGDKPALVFRGEDQANATLSRNALREKVSLFQQALAAQGVGHGDRVAAVVPNMPEAIVAFLACVSLGAIWSSCSPDFGVQGVLDRFSQIEPKVLVACDGYYYNGKRIDIRDKLSEILKQLPTLQKTFIISYLGEAEGVAADLPAAESFDAALASHPPAELRFERMPFGHPLYILFSSGTTGVPKCIVHCAGGALLQHLKEQQLHCDLTEDDNFFYFTTCGWMMWNWLVSGLASGSTLLLYDGSPFHPDGNVLFDYADAERMTFFGTSAKYIDAVSSAGLKPCETHDLSSVRTIASTGSPLTQEGFEFVYEAIKSDIHLASISGGTDIVSTFVLGHPLKPVWRGEIQSPGLGMAVDVYDDEGKPLNEGKGELVCTKPFPCMPVSFWNDPDGEKYHNAYFERFPGIWHHGDFAEWTENGGMIIHGRSDATLNPGGVRIGTAEIYRQVEQLPDVREAIVVGQDWEGDVRIVLFVILSEGSVLDDELRNRIKQRIREGASPRHVPAVILEVGDIPRTKSGKITEIAVRDIIHGRDVKNTEALANPRALELFRNRPELSR